MPRTKSSTLKVTNLYPLLQDIRNSLGENYVFYKECIVAISRATARGQDASAWFEQSERLVEGVDAVAFSHVGVQFLLREMTRGEARLARGMPPPPLPHRNQPTPPPAMDPQPPTNPYMVSHPVPNAPLSSPSGFEASVPITPYVETPETEKSALKDPNHDPIFFTDPAFKARVNAFWGTPKGSNTILDYGDGTANPLIASYRGLAALIPRYMPVDDDLRIFRESAESAERAANACVKMAEPGTERGEIIRDIQHTRYRLAAFDDN